MTAINIIRQKEAVHIITDAAGYDDRGVLLTIGSKAWALPHLNAVMAVRGPKLLAPLLADLLGQSATSYDGLKDEFAEIMRTGCGRLAVADDQMPFQITVAGWSERCGPDSYVLTNRSSPIDLEPWKVLQCGPISLAPATETIARTVLETILTGDANPDALDPEIAALKILAVQRRTKVALAYGPQTDLQFLVGGFAQITTVTPSAITTKILHRWPDVLGETIAPERI